MSDHFKAEHHVGSNQYEEVETLAAQILISMVSGQAFSYARDVCIEDGGDRMRMLVENAFYMAQRFAEKRTMIRRGASNQAE